MLEALGRLWMAGVAVDWDAFYANERRLVRAADLSFRTKTLLAGACSCDAKFSGGTAGSRPVDAHGGGNVRPF